VLRFSSYFSLVVWCTTHALTYFWGISPVQVSELYICAYFTSHHELIDRPFNSLNEARKLLVLVRGDASGNNRPRNTTGPAKGSLGSYEDVRHVLVVMLLRLEERGKHDAPSLHTEVEDEEESPMAPYRQSER
jgi:hypothetical protein